MKPKILHISFDYAEENIGKSTVVVSDLIKATEEFADISIINLKRSANPFKVKKNLLSKNFLSITHFGLPYGILLRTNMRRISNHIIKTDSKLHYLDSIDYIHAHKLTFEGFVGYNIAKRFNKKLIISLRQTDFSVLKYRKDLTDYCVQILKDAHHIFYIAPYMLNRLKNIFGDDFFGTVLRKKITFLPNCLDVDNFKFNPSAGNNRFLTIFWMEKKAVKRKNVRGLFEAIQLLNDQNFQMDIIGYGSYRPSIEKWVEELQIDKNLKFLGFVKNDEISDYLGQSKAFLLPSHSETFGVVYAEALLCGTPILYSKDTGFDGIFDGVGVAVNPRSIEDIAAGIKNINLNNDSYRKKIEELREQNAFEIFRKENVGTIYKNSLGI